MAVNNNIHDILKYHRKQAGLSQKDLADLAGVGKTVIFDLEKGKQTVKWQTILAISHALNIEINFNSPLMESYEKSRNQSS
ncbi:MAG: helix-turn-helix transcriptional regulator [Candidatus Marinimicrobia bacterium]|nr:helix-turn-helix transcriptional regulator [Candidatus Neomarinimicrobiota bacterium]